MGNLKGKKVAKKYIGKPLPTVEAAVPDATKINKAPIQKKQVGNYKKVNSTIADAIKNVVLPGWLPDNAKQLAAKLLGDARMSNSSLNDEQKVLLWDVMQNAKKRTGKADGGTEYEDYGGLGYGSSEDFNKWWNKGGVTTDNILKSFTNPGYELSSTIGRGRYWSDPEDPNKMYYTDVYDWNPSEKNFPGSNLYQIARNALRNNEDKNLNKEKNENYRMNFELNAADIEKIREKRNRPSEYYLDRNGGTLEKYDGGGPIDPRLSTVAKTDATRVKPGVNGLSPEFLLKKELEKEAARRQTYIGPQGKSATPAMRQVAEDRIAQEKTNALTRKIAEGAQTMGAGLELAAPFTGPFMPLVGGVGAGLGIGSGVYLAGKDALAGDYGSAALNAGFAGIDAAGFAALRNPAVKDFVQGADHVADYSQVADLSGINTNNIRGLGKEDISDIVKSWLGMPKPPSATTNKNSLKVLEDFKQRIQTPEGQRRLRELGIPDDSFLQKTKMVDDPSTLGVYGAYPNTIGINPNLPNTNFTNSIIRHELEHGVQDAISIAKLNKYNKDVGNFKYLFRPSAKKKALEELEKGTTAIDDILSNVELRKTPEEVDWSAIKEERGAPDPSKLFDYLSNKQNATNYFDSGSGGQEKSAFLSEIQQYMLDNGYLNHAYENVTPDKIKDVFSNAVFDEENKGKYLRLFQIMKPTDDNFQLLSEGLNKMLTAPAVIGAGAAAATLANEPEQKKNGGWLEKYNDGGPVQENYNDYSVSAPEGFQGDGYSNVGRDYSPAWGGQFAMGGSMPGAVGFTYARTNDPAPSNGPYAKKTKASAQNGEELKKGVKTVDAGMLPEITVVGSSDPQTEEFYRSLIDRAQTFGRYEGMMDLGKKYGFPKVHPIDKNSIVANLAKAQESWLGMSRSKQGVANYNPFTKTIEANKPSQWISEMAHHVQFGNAPLSTAFKTLTTDLPINLIGKNPYTEKGTMEHEAHSIIEPNLKDQVGNSAIKYYNLPYIDKLFQQHYDDNTLENIELQNGGEMKYYQEGLDWKPKTISKNGSQLTKLDQLTNFTNYNTKQPGGWLDKYEG